MSEENIVGVLIFTILVILVFFFFKIKNRRKNLEKSIDKLNKGWDEFDRAFEEQFGTKPTKKKHITVDSFLASLDRGKESKKERLIKKYGKEKGVKIFQGKIFLGMTHEMLIESRGNPEDQKEKVTRDKTIDKYYYNSRVTRQDTTVYGFEVTLENKVVIGWEELE